MNVNSASSLFADQKHELLECGKYFLGNIITMCVVKWCKINDICT